MKEKPRLVAIQEHHLVSEASMSDASMWLERHADMYAIWEPAVATGRGGSSGGTAVLAHKSIGLTPFDGISPSLVPGRATAVKSGAWCAPPPFAMVHVYLEDGTGLGQKSLDVLRAVASCAEQAGKVTWVCGAFSMPAPRLEEAGCLARNYGGLCAEAADHGLNEGLVMD